MSSPVVLWVDGLHISFAGANPFTAVNNLTFHIEKGKTVAIVGESGSGKSLTALSLLGLLPHSAASSGNIVLSGNDRNFDLSQIKTDNDWTKIRGKEIGIIFQEPMSSLNPIMRIGEQLKESIRTHQPMSGRDAKNAAIRWLDKVHLPDVADLYHRYPHELSGGQKQRVMIAMAMCNNPVLLIADEPTTSLDVTVQKEIIGLMDHLQSDHETAMIFITHDLALAAVIADHVLVMYKGTAVEYGTVDQILRRPKHPYTKALIACRPNGRQKDSKLPLVSDFYEAGEATPLKGPNVSISNNNVGRNEEILLEVNNLNVWFTTKKDLLGEPLLHFKAVDDVSFALNKGEILGLVGESGCGKSTLARTLIGILPVHSGEILFDGRDIVRNTSRQWVSTHRKVQMIFQDPFGSLNPRITVGNMLKEPLMVHNIVPKNQLQTEALRLLDLVGLPATAMDRYPHQFSGGQRQRLGIARALALKPELVICDESVSALDVSVQAQILNLLKELQQEFKLSYLFISHDLSVVHYLSDRVMVMQAGKIVEVGDAEQVLKYPAHSYTKQLVSAMPDASDLV